MSGQVEFISVYQILHCQGKLLKPFFVAQRCSQSNLLNPALLDHFLPSIPVSMKYVYVTYKGGCV